LEQHDGFIFVAENLHFAFDLRVGIVLIETAVYEKFVYARGRISFFQEQIILGERESEYDIVHNASRDLSSVVPGQKKIRGVM
jgi:hypothetical protein